MKIIDRLFDALKATGKSQGDLCEYIGIRDSTLSTWKTRRTDPPAKYILPMCKFLSISVNWLLEGEGNCFAYEKNNDLDIDEEVLITNYRKMDKEKKLQAQEALMNIILTNTTKRSEDELSATTNSTGGQEEHKKKQSESYEKSQKKENQQFYEEHETVFR